MTEIKTGFTVWFTGLPVAGKSLLAEHVALALRKEGFPKVEILDEEDFLENPQDKSKYKKKDWERLSQEIGHLANLLSQTGAVVLVSSFSPIRWTRQEIRRQHKSPFVLVFVDAAVDVLVARDKKGFYKEKLLGGIQKFTEFLDAFEKPHPPDIHVLTDMLSVEQSCEFVLNQLDLYLELDLPSAKKFKGKELAREGERL